MLIHEIERGGYAKIDNTWYLRPPLFAIRRAVALDPHKHKVEEHEDGTITVTPSLVFSTPDRPDYWHGWLQRGKWIE